MFSKLHNLKLLSLCCFVSDWNSQDKPQSPISLSKEILPSMSVSRCAAQLTCFLLDWENLALLFLCFHPWLKEPSQDNPLHFSEEEQIFFKVCLALRHPADLFSIRLRGSFFAFLMFSSLIERPKTSHQPASSLLRRRAKVAQQRVSRVAPPSWPAAISTWAPAFHPMLPLSLS